MHNDIAPNPAARRSRRRWPLLLAPIVPLLAWLPFVRRDSRISRLCRRVQWRSYTDPALVDPARIKCQIEDLHRLLVSLTLRYMHTQLSLSAVTTIRLSVLRA